MIAISKQIELEIWATTQMKANFSKFLDLKIPSHKTKNSAASTLQKTSKFKVATVSQLSYTTPICIDRENDLFRTIITLNVHRRVQWLKFKFCSLFLWLSGYRTISPYMQQFPL